MKNLLSHARKKAGQSPGSLTYTGNSAKQKSKLSYWQFNAAKVMSGASEKLEAVPTASQEDQLWLHVQGIHDVSLLRSIGERFTIHPLFLEDILNVSQRPKVEIIDDNLLLQARLFYLDDQGELQHGNISLVTNGKHLVSFGDVPADRWVELVAERLNDDQKRMREKSLYYLLYALLDSVVDQYLVTLEHLGEAIQDVDQKIFSSPSLAQLDRLYSLKKDFLVLRKYTQPVPSVLTKIPEHIPVENSAEIAIYLEDLTQHADQVSDMVRTYLDTLNNLFDLYFSLINLKMNRTVQTLTVITVVFLPLTLLTGIYGMNFIYMPGLSFMPAFWVMMLVMLALSAMILWLLKRKDWF